MQLQPDVLSLSKLSILVISLGAWEPKQNIVMMGPNSLNRRRGKTPCIGLWTPAHKQTHSLSREERLGCLKFMRNMDGDEYMKDLAVSGRQCQERSFPVRFCRDASYIRSMHIL
ncbi:hypothetical protein TWF506_009868 [Arthrobotrys conoides]|uniref:Uncharacterized protein n=1 Tax=Arthrobotrys conoides TaxID=74498 RepID=A0AAN8NLX3_9PEZI